MAIWRRKFTVPPSEQLRRNLELRKVAYDAQKRGQIYEIDLRYVIDLSIVWAMLKPELRSPPTMVVEEDAWILVVPEANEKKRRKFPWFKIDWGSL
jgi:hypothetical protein